MVNTYLTGVPILEKVPVTLMAAIEIYSISGQQFTHTR